MIKRFYILLLAIVASVGMSWALTPLSGDTWNESTKTLTVNADPGKNGYKSNTEIEHVVITDGVTSLANGAFYGCTSLTSVTLPSGLTTISYDAFRETSLASVSLPSGLISIGNNAFNQCTSLASVTFPEGLETIGIGAFSGCPSLTSVTLPESLTTVNVGVFSGCTSLASVTILAPSLSTYGKSVFYDTASGLKIYVPAASVDTYKTGWSTYADKIEAIPWVRPGDGWDDATKTLTVNSNPGYEAYYQNTEIEHLIISDDVTSIGEKAFDECTALLSVVIGNDVTNIEANAFDECGAMTSLTIGSKVQTIGESAFGSCESLTSVIIPNSVTSIGNSAFNTCDQMSSLTIGSSVQTIGESAFKNCSMLTDVTIPASVESIGAWFFRNCENLATITCEATTPPTLGNNAFFDCDKLEHIYVPAASVATYKAADNWATKEAIISAPAGPIPCTPADLGKVLCTDGSIYATVSEATAASKTAAAVIAYVDTENGKALALALADDGGTMEWATAKTTAPAHTPAVSNGTWTLASKDDWNNMITVAGSYTALRDGFSGVGGTNMQQDKYWSSTPENTNAWCYYFNYGMWTDGYVDNPCRVRACLAFDIPAGGGSTPTTWTSLSVGDVIKVGDKIEVPAEGDGSWGINGNVLKNAWGPYELIRADIYQPSEFDDPVVTEDAGGAYYVFKAENSTFYPLSNIAKGGALVVTGTSDGLEVTAAANKEFSVAVHDNGGSTAPSWVLAGDAWDEDTKTLTVNSDPGDNAYASNSEIQHLVFSDAVTSIGEYAFGDCPNLLTITIPSSVTTIGEDAFLGCTLTSITNYRSTPQSINNGMFQNMSVDPKNCKLYVPSGSVSAYKNAQGWWDLSVTEMAPPAPTPADVIALIEAIGTVELTAECKAKIDAARAAYNALPDDETKALVTNYSTLTDAEAAYAALIPTALDNTAVETKATKRIVNGQLFIERDGKTYNVVGTIVR